MKLARKETQNKVNGRGFCWTNLSVGTGKKICGTRNRNLGKLARFRNTVSNMGFDFKKAM
jgi:hypothetical protein